MRLAIFFAAGMALSAQTYQISGALVDAASDNPVNRAHVVLTGLRNGEISIVTASDGRFQFEVPAGKYGLFAERRGYRQTYGNLLPGEGFGSAVVTGPDQETSNLVFRWFTPGSIYGRVMDDRGDPVQNATVQLIRQSVVVGRKRIANYNYAYTDDLGNYRLGPLPAGEYFMVVMGRPWFAQAVPVSFEPGSVTPPQETYAPAFYPNTTNAQGAAAIAIKAGSEVQANFTLTTVTGSNVKPICAGQNTPLTQIPGYRPGADRTGGDPTAGALANQRIQEMMARRCAGSVYLYLHTIGDMETVLPGTFLGPLGEMTGVPPGRYTVRYTAPAGGGAMRRIIDVSGTEVDIDLAALKQPSLSGTVTLKNSSMQARGTIYVRLINEATGSAIARAVDKDGRFSWTAVAPAKLRVQVSGSNPFLIDRMEVKGTTVEDGVLDVVDGDTVQLQIVATDETGRLKGFVKDGEKGVMAALVVLAPRGSTDLNDYRGFQTESDGSFDFVNIRAGDYFLFAVKKADLEYSNVEAVKPYLAGAKQIHVNAHATGSETIGVVAEAGAAH